MNKENPPNGENTMDHLLSAVLILMIIIAILVTIFVISAPKENEQFTDFFILGENGTADVYPGDVISGRVYPMYIGVGNHESVKVNYTVETWYVDSVFDNATNSTTILAMDPVDTFPVALANNETSIIPYDMPIRGPGYNRVEFLLFKDTVAGPEITGSDRIAASYRDLYLRVSIS